MGDGCLVHTRVGLFGAASPKQMGTYHVPTIPLSQDEQRYGDLQRSLAVYRMVFGQPRQEDLLAYLVDRVSPERLDELRPLLQIDLRPKVIE